MVGHVVCNDETRVRFPMGPFTKNKIKENHKSYSPKVNLGDETKNLNTYEVQDKFPEWSGELYSMIQVEKSLA